MAELLYLTELLGLRVFDLKGRRLGVVRDAALVPLIDPVRDFEAFLELRRQGRLTFRQWLDSVLHRQTFPYFCWSDPLPSLVRSSKPLRDLLHRESHRCPTS